jgi:hypothetical protein
LTTDHTYFIIDAMPGSSGEINPVNGNVPSVSALFQHVTSRLENTGTPQFSEGVTSLVYRLGLLTDPHNGFQTERTIDQLPPLVRPVAELLDRGSPKSPLTTVGIYQDPSFFAAMLPTELADFAYSKQGRSVQTLPDWARAGGGLDIIFSFLDPDLRDAPDRPRTKTGLILEASLMFGVFHVSQFGGNSRAKKPAAIDTALHKALADPKQQTSVGHRMLTAAAVMIR